ncbi:MAG: hypothetical protein ACRDIB_14525 [Ardenticatenaceae bacterium]
MHKAAPSPATWTTFRYDAAGQRAQTLIEQPDASRTVVYTPFPHYEEEFRYTWNGTTWQQAAAITRSSYFLAGQRVATWVVGDPEAANNGLYFVLGDQLGSVAPWPRQAGPRKAAWSSTSPSASTGPCPPRRSPTAATPATPTTTCRRMGSG